MKLLKLLKKRRKNRILLYDNRVIAFAAVTLFFYLAV
jgi:hypothetical protein